jgi:glycosyltransferase involved in cell wall biosynthesis
MYESMLSVVIPVTRANGDFADLFEAYDEALGRCGRDLEYLFVLEGANHGIRDYLQGLQERGRPVRVFQLAKAFGEAAALTVGFGHARGDVLLTLPDHFQVEPASLPKLLDALEDSDMVVTRRWPRRDSRFSRMKTAVFNRLVSFRGGMRFSDLGCSARILRKAVADEVPLYGDQDIFFPLLARQNGFVVKEIDLPQSRRTPYRRHHGSGVYLRRLLDVFAVWFLAKFIRKPLRFFGLIGTTIAVVGFIVLLYVIIERLFFGISLADRPALLLSSLMAVLGVQLVGMGLIAELVIFTHAKELKEYQVREIVNGQSKRAADSSQGNVARRDSVSVPD